jgi:hypothetical protein
MSCAGGGELHKITVADQGRYTGRAPEKIFGPYFATKEQGSGLDWRSPIPSSRIMEAIQEASGVVSEQLHRLLPASGEDVDASARLRSTASRQWQGSAHG